MKKNLISNFTAPSPAVLDFLRSQVRNAFDSPTARCAALKSKGYRQASTCATTGDLGARERNGKLPCLALNTQRNRLLVSNSPATARISSSSSRRTFSTTQNSRWSLWPSQQRPHPSRLQAPVSPLASVVEDASNGLSALGRATRSANELKMRCTELDESGNVTMVSGEFKKSELIAKVCRMPLFGVTVLIDSSTAFSPEISAKSTPRSSHTSSSGRQPY